MSQKTSPQRPFAIAAALALLPCLALAICVHRWGTTLPFIDQWDTPGLLFIRHLRGQLVWENFFAQHNEARKAFSSVVWMALGWQGWNVRVEMYLALALSYASVLVYFALCWRARLGSVFAPCVLTVLAAIVLLNPTGLRGELSAWLWGVNSENTIILAALLLGIATNVFVHRWWLRYALVAALCLVATYTFASGLALWVLLSPRLYGRMRSPERPRDLRAWLPDLAYVTLFIVVVATYFHGYFRPPDHPSMLDSLRMPFVTAEFYCAWFGAPLTPQLHDPHAAAAVGAVALAAWLVCVALVLRRRMWSSAAPFLILSTYALLAAAAVALGRATEGTGAAIAPRYVVHVATFWMGLNGLLWCCVRSTPRVGTMARTATLLATGLVAVEAPLVLQHWRQVYPRLTRDFYQSTRRGEAALQFVNLIEDNPDIYNIFPNGPIIVPRFRELVANGVLDVTLAPYEEALALAPEPVALDDDLRLEYTAGLVRIQGVLPRAAAPGGPLAGFTHVLLRAEQGDTAQFFAVFPMLCFESYASATAPVIDACASTRELEDGPYTVRIFVIDLDAERLIATDATTGFRKGPVRLEDTLDATTLDIQDGPTQGSLDTLNGAPLALDRVQSIPASAPLVLTGWMIDGEGPRLAERLFVRIGERLFPAHYHMPRADVARALRDDSLTACGFRCEVEPTLLPGRGPWTVQVVLETSAGSYVSHPAVATVELAAD